MLTGFAIIKKDSLHLPLKPEARPWIRRNKKRRASFYFLDFSGGLTRIIND